MMWWPCVEVERMEKRGSSAGECVWCARVVEGTAAVGWSGYRCDVMLVVVVRRQQDREREREEGRGSLAG